MSRNYLIFLMKTVLGLAGGLIKMILGTLWCGAHMKDMPTHLSATITFTKLKNRFPSIRFKTVTSTNNFEIFFERLKNKRQKPPLRTITAAYDDQTGNFMTTQPGHIFESKDDATTESESCQSCGGIKSRDRKCWCWSAPITSKEEAYALSRRILQRETASAFSFDDSQPTFRGRKPDLYLPGYLSRWWIIPRNRWFNIYLHRFEGSDDERAIHDHPWYSVSFLLKGEMIEHSFKGVRHIPWLLPIFRTAKFAHRLELVKGPVWTVFIMGPKIREWGFYCPKGWLFHSTFGKRGGCE